MNYVISVPKAEGDSLTRSIAGLARQALLMEVMTWPKPGLVSHRDSGSHADMTLETFQCSADAIVPYFQEMADAGSADAPMSVLRRIGLRAEDAMLAATAGVNTHRGAIFGMGLLCAAAGAATAPGGSSGAGSGGSILGRYVASRWGRDILAGSSFSQSHGATVSRRYGIGGARTEAAAGFPSVYEVGLPALRAACRLLPTDPEASRIHAFFSLLAEVEDTNLFHRGGRPGADFARTQARGFLACGSVRNEAWRDEAERIHRLFVQRRLSPGGCGDLLAMTLFVEHFESLSSMPFLPLDMALDR